jgi:hypothetical protein
MEPGLFHLIGDAGGVLGDLGERDVRVDDREAGQLKVGLESSQPPVISPESHESDVSLVAEDGDRHNLEPVGLGSLDGLDDSMGVEATGSLPRRGVGFAEQVEDAPPD